MVDVFHHLRLPDRYARGARGGGGWSTKVVTTRGGEEQRQSDFDVDLGRWKIGHLIKSEAAADALQAFHHNRRGMATGFRFKWWKDYAASRTYQGLGDGTADPFQLKKTYADIVTGTAQAGALSTITLQASHPEWLYHGTDDTYNGTIVRIASGLGAGQMRRITDYDGTTKVASVAPDWGTNPDSTSVYEIALFSYQKTILTPTPDYDAVAFQLYVNDNPVSATLDYAGGTVMPAGAITANAIVSADFEHDLPVRFDMDFQEWEWRTVRRHDWRDIGLVELLKIA